MRGTWPKEAMSKRNWSISQQGCVGKGLGWWAGSEACDGLSWGGLLSFLSSLAAHCSQAVCDQSWSILLQTTPTRALMKEQGRAWPAPAPLPALPSPKALVFISSHYSPSLMFAYSKEQFPSSNLAE